MPSQTPCVYRNCGLTKFKCPELTFFTFPVKNSDICLQWCINAGAKQEICDLLDTEEGLKALRNKVICSKHFDISNFKDTTSKFRKLKDGAVPFMLSSEEDMLVEKEKSPDDVPEPTEMNLAGNNDPLDSVGLTVESSSVTSHTGTNQNQSYMITESADNTQQPSSPPGELRVFNEVQKPDVAKEINGFCGFASLKTENDLGEFCGVSLNVFGLLLSLLPIDDVNSNFRREDHLLIFLLRMKTGNSFSFIKNLFSVSSAQEVTRIFSDILLRLKNETQKFIVWPDKQSVVETMPYLFRNGFSNCRVILYCLQIQVEPPNQPYQAAGWYANLKDRVKKVLIGFTPSGAISFVSKLFPGDLSLIKVIIQSDILALLEPKDFAFLVFDDNQHDIDWNLLSKYVTDKRIISILTPPRNQNSAQTNPTETPQKTLIWAHAINQIKRVKSHKILYNYSWERMCYLLQDVVFMTCVLANLQPVQESVPS